MISRSHLSENREFAAIRSIPPRASSPANRARAAHGPVVIHATTSTMFVTVLLMAVSALHARNRHLHGYDMARLASSHAALAPFLRTHPDGCGSMVKAQSGLCPSSAPVPPQGAPGGSRQLGTPRKRPCHCTPSQCLGLAASEAADVTIQAADSRLLRPRCRLDAQRGAARVGLRLRLQPAARAPDACGAGPRGLHPPSGRLARRGWDGRGDPSPNPNPNPNQVP